MGREPSQAHVAPPPSRFAVSVDRKGQGAQPLDDPDHRRVPEKSCKAEVSSGDLDPDGPNPPDRPGYAMAGWLRPMPR